MIVLQMQNEYSRALTNVRKFFSEALWVKHGFKVGDDPSLTSIVTLVTDLAQLVKQSEGLIRELDEELSPTMRTDHEALHRRILIFLQNVEAVLNTAIGE